MNYINFEKSMKPYGVFSLKDIKKQFPGFDNRRLYEWQQKGYLIKIKRGYYCLAEQEKKESFLHFVANKIYKPSYISMESALSYYNLIPEGVFMVTSITTRNTMIHDTPLGRYEYKHVKPNLFFGYHLIQWEGFTVKIASPEKLILDFFYLKKYNRVETIKALRINREQLHQIIDINTLSNYQMSYRSKVLDKRIEKFIKTLYA